MTKAKYADETKFDFTWYAYVDGHPVAEVGGECVVDYEGNLQILLEDIFTFTSAAALPADHYWHKDIVNMLMIDHAADIDLASRAAQRDRLEHDREVAIDLRQGQ